MKIHHQGLRRALLHVYTTSGRIAPALQIPTMKVRCCPSKVRGSKAGKTSCPNSPASPSSSVRTVSPPFNCQPSCTTGGLLGFFSGNLQVAGEQHALKFSQVCIYILGIGEASLETRHKNWK
ncbi:hypothetical protein SLA2020_289420 [Shorea laevis]